MRIVVPVRAKEGMDSSICPLKEAKAYALLQLGKGMDVDSLEFFEDFERDFDYMVVMDKNEDLEEIFELGARALLAREGMDLEGIVEALMFKELDEIV